MDDILSNIFEICGRGFELEVGHKISELAIYDVIFSQSVEFNYFNYKNTNMCLSNSLLEYKFRKNTDRPKTDSPKLTVVVLRERLDKK